MGLPVVTPETRLRVAEEMAAAKPDFVTHMAQVIQDENPVLADFVGKMVASPSPMNQSKAMTIIVMMYRFLQLQSEQA